MKLKIEEFAPDMLLEQLVSRVAKLEELISYKKTALDGAPEGRLRISVRNGVSQYYKVCKKYSNGCYICKKDLPLVKKLAQKQYDEELLKAAGFQVEAIKDLIGILNKNDLRQVLEKLSAEKKVLVEPVTLTDEEYAERWLDVEYCGKPFKEGSVELFTARGERVRSKSEVIIADTLNRMGVPYRYEFPVELKRFTVYPDFYCLNVRTRKVFVWEHFGMMSDSDYAGNVLEKLDAYGEKSWIPGKNLIFTMESDMRPLSSKMIERMILEFLV